jgi:hypothetical protein
MLKILFVPDGTQVIPNIQQNLKHYFSNHKIKAKCSKLNTLHRRIILEISLMMAVIRPFIQIGLVTFLAENSL